MSSGSGPFLLHAGKIPVWPSKGAAAYLQYHHALYATGHTGGKLTREDIEAAAKAVQFDARTAPDVQFPQDSINTLGQQLGFGGTPAVVLLPSAGARADSITVIPGGARAEELQQAINKAATSPEK